MIREIKELRRIKGKMGLYEAEALTTLMCPEEYIKTPWTVVVTKTKTINIIQPDGSKKVAYQCGEKYFTYDENEQKEYLAEWHRQRKEAGLRRKALAVIAELCTEDLIELAEHIQANWAE